MAKKISKDLYEAYLTWIKAEDRVNDLHHAFGVLTDKHLGSDHDKMDSGMLIVQLARMRLNGESPSGKASVFGTDSEGSNPSSPEKTPSPKPDPPKIRLLKD